MINPADTKIGNERFLSGVQKKRPEKQIHFELQNTLERPFLLSPKGKTFHGESNKQIKLKPGMCVPFVATQSPRVFPRSRLINRFRNFRFGKTKREKTCNKYPDWLNLQIQQKKKLASSSTEYCDKMNGHHWETTKQYNAYEQWVELLLLLLDFSDTHFGLMMVPSHIVAFLA